MRLENAAINNKKNSNRTKNIQIFLYSLFVIFIPFFILWILSVDLNLLNLTWILPVGADLDADTMNQTLIFNPTLVYIMIGITAFSILLFFVLKFLFKILNFDLLPFIVSLNFFCWAAILTGAIGYSTETFFYILLARFVIAIFSLFVSFVIINKITVLLIVKFENPAVFIEELEEERKQLRALGNETRKVRSLSKRDETTIDVVGELK